MNKIYEKKISYILFLLSIVLIEGCNKDKHIIDRYYLSYTDSKSDLSVCYKFDNGGLIGNMPPRVFEMGYNEEYILAAIHPCKTPYHPDTSITQYYIVPIKKLKSNSPDLNRYGPFDLQGLEAKRKELGVSDTIKLKPVD